MGWITLPIGLQRLSFCRMRSQQRAQVSPLLVPEALSCITRFKQSMDQLTLLFGLQCLSLGSLLSHQMALVRLLPGLQTLTFSARYKWSMGRVTLRSFIAERVTWQHFQSVEGPGRAAS